MSEGSQIGAGAPPKERQGIGRVASVIVLLCLTLAGCGRSPKQLARIAMKDRDFDVCKAAVLRLQDQTLLAEIAEKAENIGVRQVAVKKLEDQGLLARIATEKNDWVFLP